MDHFERRTQLNEEEDEEMQRFYLTHSLFSHSHRREEKIPELRTPFSGIAMLFVVVLFIGAVWRLFFPSPLLKVLFPSLPQGFLDFLDSGVLADVVVFWLIFLAVRRWWRKKKAREAGVRYVSKHTLAFDLFLWVGAWIVPDDKEENHRILRHLVTISTCSGIVVFYTMALSRHWRLHLVIGTVVLFAPSVHFLRKFLRHRKQALLDGEHPFEHFQTFGHPDDVQ